MSSSSKHTPGRFREGHRRGTVDPTGLRLVISPSSDAIVVTCSDALARRGNCGVLIGILMRSRT